MTNAIDAAAAIALFEDTIARVKADIAALERWFETDFHGGFHYVITMHTNPAFTAGAAKKLATGGYNFSADGLDAALFLRSDAERLIRLIEPKDGVTYKVTHRRDFYAARLECARDIFVTMSDQLAAFREKNPAE